MCNCGKNRSAGPAIIPSIVGRPRFTRPAAAARPFAAAAAVPRPGGARPIAPRPLTAWGRRW